MIVVDVPDLRPVSVNRLHAEHYLTRQTRTKREREAVRKALAHVERPALPVRCLFVRVGPQLLDSDCVPYSFKAARDEVTAWLGLPNDSPRETRVRWAYRQAVAREPCIYKGKRAFRIWARIVIESIGAKELGNGQG